MSDDPTQLDDVPDRVEYLTVEDALAAAAASQGRAPHVRDYGLLEAAVHRPQATIFGEDVYRTIHDKAAALLLSLIKNHALVDGNKRLGLVGMLLFYAMNDYRFVASDDEKYDLVVEVADGHLSEVEETSDRLRVFARRTL